jgi:hypothetical protein
VEFIASIGLVILVACFGWELRASRSEAATFEAQRLRDEAWDLAHNVTEQTRG